MTPRTGSAGLDSAETAGAALARGELAVFPTETLYAIGCSALDAAAIARLLVVKERPPGKPFLVLVSDRAMADGLVATWPAAAGKLADIFWPGPLTLLLPARPGVHPALVEDGKIGIRLPPDGPVRDLLRAARCPLVAPSANPAGHPPAHDLAEARRFFAGRVAAWLDGGRLEGSPSTVVDPGPPLRVIRAGVIAEEDLIRASGGR